MWQQWWRYALPRADLSNEIKLVLVRNLLHIVNIHNLFFLKCIMYYKVKVKVLRFT